MQSGVLGFLFNFQVSQLPKEWHWVISPPGQAFHGIPKDFARYHNRSSFFTLVLHAQMDKLAFAPYKARLRTSIR